MSVRVHTNNVLDRIVGTIFTVVIVCLMALFWIQIFAPGNEITSWFFTLIQPITNILQKIYAVVGWPIRWLCGLIASILPAPLLKFFPTTNVQTLVTGILDLFKFIPGFYENALTQSIYNFNYQYWFPGIIDWQILLTVNFVAAIETFIFQMARQFDGGRSERAIQNDSYSNNVPYTDQPPIQVAPQYAPQPGYQSFDQAQPLLAPSAHIPTVTPLMPVPEGYDVETGLMGAQAFLAHFEQQLEFARQHRQHIGLLWLELGTLPVAPPNIQQQLGRWLSNLKPKEGRLLPARYGPNTVLVMLIEQNAMQAGMVASHLQQRLGEFRFMPLVGLAHVDMGNYSAPGQVTTTQLLQHAQASLAQGTTSFVQSEPAAF